jgi:FixJ family two-component response regulator
VSTEPGAAHAVEFLPKPFREQDLLDAIRCGIESDRRRREREEVTRAARLRAKSLTAREREMMLLIAEGRIPQEIAATLHLSEVTVKVHSARMMKKLELRSPVEVARLVDIM